MTMLNSMFGVKYRHCVNGITKEEVRDIRTIPELDERVTALESSNGWKIYQSYDWSGLVDNPSDDNPKFIKDTLFVLTLQMYYASSGLNYDYSTCYSFFPKGSILRVVDINGSSTGKKINTNLYYSSYGHVTFNTTELRNTTDTISKTIVYSVVTKDVTDVNNPVITTDLIEKSINLKKQKTDLNTYTSNYVYVYTSG